MILLFSLLGVTLLPWFTLQVDAQTSYTLVDNINSTMTSLGDNNSHDNKIVTVSHPYISPNPVGQAGRVGIVLNYSENNIGIDSVRINIHGPNIGSTDPKLAPVTIGSAPMLLVSGTPRNGIWSANFTFSNHIPDGNYLYSLTITDKIGHVTTAGPYSSIILDRNQPDPAETTIVSATDNSGMSLQNRSITNSPNITFTFQGIDKTGVIQLFQCNLDDIVIRSEHDHGDDQSQAPSTYSPCFTPTQIAAKAVGNYTYTNLGVGNHTFKVRALDNEYNLDMSPPNFSWVIVAPPIPADPRLPSTIQ